MSVEPASSQPSLIYSLGAGAAAQALVWPGVHILERITVAQQSDPELRTIRQAMRHMYKKGGFAEFSKGARWTFTSSISKGIARWVTYSGYYQFYGAVLPQQFQKQFPEIVSGCVGVSSGLTVATFVNCPLDNLKIREMTSDSKISKLIAKEGKFRFYTTGWTRGVLKQSFSLTTYLITYEKFKQWLQACNQDRPAKLYQKIGISIGAGTISCFFSTPIDVLKTQAQKENPLKGNMLAAARVIYQRHGIAGFYSSLLVKLMRSGWHASTLGAMDYLGALPDQMKA